MPKRIYQVGEPCDVCGTTTIRGKDGNGYCWPCWSKWKDAQKATQAPPQPQTPQIDPKLAEVLKKISERLTAIDNAIERNRWYTDEILKKLDPKWSALSQDEVSINDIPK